MGVRVKVRIKSSRGETETPALVNTGFETEQPEILLPVKLAEELGLYPPKRGSMLQEYSAVGGTTLLIRSSESAYVQVMVEDRGTDPTEAVPLISDKESEALISDKLASRLKISIDDPAEGIWRFRDDPPIKKRTSESPKYWT